MADINTQAQFDRTNKVFVSGVTERGTRADRESIGDFTVLMQCPNGHPREVQLRRVQDLITMKGFKIGYQAKPVPKARKVSKHQARKDAEVLFKEAGGEEIEK